MSRNSRGSSRSSKHPKQNQNQKNSQKPNANRDQGGEFKKANRFDRDDGYRVGFGNDDADERPSRNDRDARGKNKKPIKNARSLRDVVGGGAQSKGASFAPARRPSSPQAEAPKTISKKLQYIMTFQPPGSQRPEVQEVDAQVTKLTAKPAAQPAARRPEPPKQPPRDQKPSAPQNYQWPKDRIATPAEPEGERRMKSFTKSGKRGDHTVSGVIKRHPDGYGFLVADDREHPDVYISRQSMLGVMSNDRVEVIVYRPKPGQPKNDRLSGEIAKVLSRANKTIVGKYLAVDQKYGVILDEGRGWGADLHISTKDAMGAQDGQVVAVEVIQYPGTDTEFTGRVVGVIGDLDNPINDVIRIVHQSGIPTEFSALALGEARKFGGEVTAAEAKGREDLTTVPLITIDGTTARDFDDAVYTEQVDNGFRLIVAIADVSHYVKPGTPLDQEAYERGTSTYFPNYVVPMLPEELSNELCSLKPKVKRLCFACEMNLDFEGNVKSFRFFEAVMESKARVTYGEAQELLDTHASRAEGGATKGRSPTLEKLKHVEENILRSADLAKILMAKRFREGSLDLEIPETQVVVDASGESVDVIKSERLFAHRLIEELMLVTNICTARFMEDKQIPGIYRVHEEPDPDAIQSLQRYLWNFGGSRSVMGSNNLQKKLTKALESMEGKPEAQILNILTLRTMRQAHYSQDNVGHFGLGFSQYSHFTSPIRRYPDLIAHRIIKSQLYPKYKSMAMTDEELASASTMLSACEQRSTKAERKVVSIKKARFMRKWVGEEFEGIISSVTKFGVFVLLRQFDVDGLVKIERLGNDRFMFDDQNLRLIGSRTGARYSIGDSIRVLVTASDPETGKIDFDLPDEVRTAVMQNTDFDDDDLDDQPAFHKRGSKGRRNERPAKAKGSKKSGKGSRKQANEPASKDARKDQSKDQRKDQKEDQRNDRKAKSKTRSKKPLDVQERGKAENDRRRVRKKRVSERRGEN